MMSPIFKTSNQFVYLTMRLKNLLVIFVLLAGCKSQQVITVTPPPSVEKPVVVQPKDTVKYKPPVLVKKDTVLDYKIGQMILVGISNRKVLAEDDSLREEISTGKVGGIILFEKNISSEKPKETLKKLITDLQSEARIPLFMSIDEEGGKVHRLKEKYGFIKMPEAAYLGGLRNSDSTFYYTKKLAALLSDLGFNVNFAPAVDVALNPNNPVIAKVGRSYSENPKTVSSHALASIKAHHIYGVKTALKHFPGHGSSMTDSHLGITDVTKLWKESELIPYKDILRSGTCDAIMTAHIVNCKLDTTCLPATMSHAIVTGLLRNKLGFKGVVFSDDMQMHAISKNYGLENAVKMSILAGVDVVVFGNNVPQTTKATATEIHAIIKKLVLSGEISEARIDESYNRIMELKGKKFN
jgi:beta-N-acetylhexosaminidase